MQTTTQHSGRCAAIEHPTYPALESVNRPTVDTAAASHYLNRRPQTLFDWSCNGKGPIRPIRINGRLAWPVSELRRVLGVPA